MSAAASLDDSHNVEDVLSAIEPEDESEEPFAWLRSLEYDSSYNEYDFKFTAKSSDFGSNGYTASVTDWHELWQLTAPDPLCGIVYARGDFPDTPDAILARVQKRDLAGGKGTFGFQLLCNSETNFSVGSVEAQGLINYRWPYLQYELQSKTFEDGTYELCSFVKDDVVYQIARLQPGKLKEIVGPELDRDERPQSFDQGNSGRPLEIITNMAKPSKIEPQTQPLPKKKRNLKERIRFRIGGKVRFGCICSNGLTTYSDQYTVESMDDHHLISCKAQSYHSVCRSPRQAQICLNAQLFVDGNAQVIVVDGDKPAGVESVDYGVGANMAAVQEIELEAGKARVIISTFALNAYPVSKNLESLSKPSGPKGILGISLGVEDFLGIGNKSVNCTSRMWSACQSQEKSQEREQIDKIDSNAIAKSVEYICSVTAVPLTSNKDDAPRIEDNNMLSPSSTESKQGYAKDPKLPGSSQQMVLESAGLLDNSDLPTSDAMDFALQPPQATPPGLGNVQVAPLAVEVPVLTPMEDGLRSLENKATHQSDNMAENSVAIALVQNILLPQYVDLESTFWQIRLLVKAHKFLSLQSFGKGASADEHMISSDDSNNKGEDKTLESIYASYNSRLEDRIKGVLIWMLRIATLPLPHPEYQAWDYYSKLVPTMMSQFEFEGFPNSYNHASFNPPWNPACFITIIIWYVLQNCPDIAGDLLKNATQSHITSIIPGIFKREPLRDLTAKPALLQWYHSSCLLKITKLIGKESAESPKETQQLVDLDERVRKLGIMSERLINPSRKIKSDPYSHKDEMVDRLALLSEELAIDSTSSIACAAHARQKIGSREYTVMINPGFTKSKSTSTDGPWELLCLNHHSTLKIAVETADWIEIKNAKKACFDFLSSDSTFLASWDRSKGDMLGRWWDIDVSGVVCATLLDMYTSTRDKSESKESNQVLDRQTQYQREIAQLSSKPKTEQFDMSNRMPIIVHPDEWVQSLDDTPDKFHSSQTKDVKLRTAVLKYLRDRGHDIEMSPPSYTLENIYEQIPTEDLLYMSHFDLALSLTDNIIYRRYWWGRVDTMAFRSDILGDSTIEDEGDLLTRLFLWILDGRPWDTFESFSSLPPELRNRVQGLNFRRDVRIKHRRLIMEQLSDSMVDKQVKHRILLAQRCSPSIVKAFIYMWHPSAIDTFDNYFGPASSFSNSREQDIWTTTITITHWGFNLPGLPPDVSDRYIEPRQRGAYPPSNVTNLRRSSRRKRKLMGSDWSSNRKNASTIEEKSSSLVITGDFQGHLWNCSVWSSLIDAAQMLVYVDASREILQAFINQQSSGRSLVFVFLLGVLCKHLAEEFEAIMKELEEYVELGPRVFLEGYNWEDDDAVDKLKSMLWGLEALRMFEDRISSSLVQIKQARETLIETIEDEPGEFHTELDRTYRKTTEEFGKRYDLLVSTQTRIQLKIKQVTGLRDGISTVTNVQDSHIAVRQGNNIRVLTLITIAYLPLGFVTSLFSMGHGIVPDDVGNTVFAILVAVFVIGTYSLALSLESVMKVLGPKRAKLYNKFRDWLDGKTMRRRVDKKVSDSPKKSVSALNGTMNGAVIGLAAPTKQSRGFLGLGHRSHDNSLDAAEKALRSEPTEVQDFAK